MKKFILPILLFFVAFNANSQGMPDLLDADERQGIIIADEDMEFDNEDTKSICTKGIRYTFS